MKRKRWTETEAEFLKANYAKLGIRECMNELGRSWPSVTQEAQKLGLTVPSELHGERIRQVKLGRPRSEATRRKLSLAKKGQPAYNKIPRERLIQELLNLAYVLDRSPKMTEMQVLSRFSFGPFVREFGSWGNALKAAGLPPAPKLDGIESPDAILLRPCEICGQLMEIPHWWPNRRFCKRACFGIWFAQNNTGEQNPRWKGGKFPYYGPNWRRQRRRARKRDNYVCQRCGITEIELGRELDVHHITPFRKFGLERYKEANRLDNLICYCPPCHRIVEDSQ